ncbi:hypothetical protein Tco_0029116, partial [Tanacetum coccineum]
MAAHSGGGVLGCRFDHPEVQVWQVSTRYNHWLVIRANDWCTSSTFDASGSPPVAPALVDLRILQSG